MPPWLRRHATALAVLGLALVAYLPALASSPGRMPADTKLYLYLDPGRLISDAPWTFDDRQFAGWVPHQVIAYLWPQGPWYWVAERAGLPDWVAHRLWIGTLFLAAGAGVLWLARRLGLGLTAALAAALVYQLTPYTLPYVSRTSAMLLPWAGLGWLIGLTSAAATVTRWRHAALAALVVVTAGSINPTALLMIAPGPVLWLVVAVGRRLVTWRQAVAAALKIGGLSLLACSWWIAMVAIQGREGADVLAFSESLEAVSFTSTSTEVWRNLGYWLTYIRDAYDATTSAGRDYMVSGRLIATGFALVLIALCGLVATRWVHRAFAVSLVVCGVVLGVGVHPIGDPSPLMSALLGDEASGAALALRSSTRAVPLLVLGLGLGAGALVDAATTLRGSRRWWRPAVATAVVLLAVANQPAITGRRLVDPALDRDQDVPAAWTDAVDALDADADGGRVLQLPGQEFGAYRWGYTVDPPLPGLTDRPLITRDLLPLGSAATMDLVYALDDRFQSGTIEPSSIAPVARLLGAGTIWISGDVAFERFRTPRPELVHDLFSSDVPGLADAVPYGDPAVNAPRIPMTDEQAVSDPRVGEPVPPVELVTVEDRVPVIRAKDDLVIVVGSGDGVVDAAAAGLVDGHELLRYSGSLRGQELDAAVDAASRVIVTDTNRERAHHWRSSQDVVGLTEDDDPASNDVLRLDPADERLEVFGADGAPATVAVQEGPVRARATAYGEPFAYRPEDRPVMAVDGDPATAWRVGDRADPRGEHIRLDLDAAIDHLVLRQPAGAASQRHITRVRIEIEGRAPVVVDLDERSLEGPGQRVELEPTTGPSAVTVTIEEVASPTDMLGPALAAVGFAEIDTGLGPTAEVVRPPADAALVLTAADDIPVSFVLTRLRTRDADRWRADPEPTLVRDIELPAARSFRPTVTVRLDQRASDAVLAELLQIDGPLASRRLTGVATAAGWAATDGDADTAWQTPFADAVGATLDLAAPSDVTSLTITQPGGEHSPITGLRLHAGGTAVDAAVGPPDANGTSVVALPTAVPAGPIRLEITGIEQRWTLDRRYAEPVTLPAAVSELAIGSGTTMPARVDTGCRDDLIAIDGQPLPVRIAARVDDLLAGRAVDADVCGDGLVLDAGRHRLETAPGVATGLEVDRVVLSSDGTPAARSTGDADPVVTVRDEGRTSRDVTVEGCRAGCWLVLGEGLHPAWSASTAAGDLGPPQLVDGGFNGWWLEPNAGSVDVSIRWKAQRPLNLAMGLSAMAIAGCLTLAVMDRRRAPASVAAPPRLGLGAGPVPWRARALAAGTWIVAAGLLVGPGWALVAALAGLPLVAVLGRPRLAGAVTIGILAVMGAVVVRVVQRERPWPDAGWPARFEWLHGLGLFAAVSLLVTVVTGRLARGTDPATSDVAGIASRHRGADRRRGIRRPRRVGRGRTRRG